MNNKVLINLIIPELDVNYDVYIPANKRIGNIIQLLNKAIMDLNNSNYIPLQQKSLYNKITGQKYSPNELIRTTDIRNGTSLILI